MKKYSHLLLVLAALMAVILSACGGAVATETSAGGDKPRASLVEFTGVIEAMDGDQWTINGQTITVDPAVLRDGPFEVGDTIKVKAEVQADGSVVVTRVEPPSADDDANSNDDNSNGNSNDDNANDDDTNGNSNDDNSNDDDGDDNSNDDSNSNDDDGDDNSNDDDGDDNSGSGGDDDEDDDDSGSGDDD